MLSGEMKDLETQSIMIKLANDYDKLADRAEERASRDKTPGPSPMPKVRRSLAKYPTRSSTKQTLGGAKLARSRRSPPTLAICM